LKGILKSIQGYRPSLTLKNRYVEGYYANGSIGSNGKESGAIEIRPGTGNKLVDVLVDSNFISYCGREGMWIGNDRSDWVDPNKKVVVRNNYLS
jgi:hypothetical protein